MDFDQPPRHLLTRLGRLLKHIHCYFPTTTGTTVTRFAQSIPSSANMAEEMGRIVYTWPKYPESDEESKATADAASKLVDDAFAAAPSEVATETEVESLWEFRVPHLSIDGTCNAADGKLDEEPHNHGHLLRVDEADERKWGALTRHPHTLRLATLASIAIAAQRELGCEWFGIYRVVKTTKTRCVHAVIIMMAHSLGMFRPINLGADPAAGLLVLVGWGSSRKRTLEPPHALCFRSLSRLRDRRTTRTLG